MSLTLEQYATYLDSRDLPWPAPPQVERPKARPHLAQLPDIQAVLWNVYGTLLVIPYGDLLFEHPTRFVMDVALDKTIQEFKMWGSMTRKPGLPADYLREVYANLLHDQKNVLGGSERHPEVNSERLWEGFIKKLLQKEYKFDTGFYGALNEFSRKVAYFFHASLQATACYPGVAEALKIVKDKGLAQGALGDGQCFTMVQLQRGLMKQDPAARVENLFDAELWTLSHEVRARKPSERLYRHALEQLAKRDISAAQILHVGSRIAQDVIPARKLGMKTALFAGDKASLAATPEQLKEPNSRPDVMLTEASQIADVLG